MSKKTLLALAGVVLCFCLAPMRARADAGPKPSVDIVPAEPGELAGYMTLLVEDASGIRRVCGSCCA